MAIRTKYDPAIKTACAHCGRDDVELDDTGICFDVLCCDNAMERLRSAGVKGDYTPEELRDARTAAGGDPTLKLMLGEMMGGGGF